MDFENSLTYLFTQLANAHRNNLQKALNEIGLHSGQIFILISLWNSDAQSQIDLSKDLSLAPPTINKLIKGLINNGFVDCQKGDGDGRIMRVYLTDKSRQIRTLVEERWLKNESDFFSTLSDTERLMLRHLFEKLKENRNGKVAPKSSDI